MTQCLYRLRSGFGSKSAGDGWAVDLFLPNLGFGRLVLHAPWALYKEDTATPAQEGEDEDFIELFNAAAEVSA
jgi:hypothetical protein